MVMMMMTDHLSNIEATLVSYDSLMIQSMKDGSDG
jgi:hypothetical protein